MWAPLLAIAGLAVDILIGAIASDDRIESLGAVLALETLAMPRTALGQHLLSGEYYAAAARAALAGWGLDLGSVDDGRLGSLLTAQTQAQSTIPYKLYHNHKLALHFGDLFKEESEGVSTFAHLYPRHLTSSQGNCHRRVRRLWDQSVAHSKLVGNTHQKPQTIKFRRVCACARLYD